MATKKDLEFIDYIFEATSTGKANWEAAAEKNSFVTSLRGKYRLTLRKAFDREDGTYYYYVRLADENDQELLKVYSPEYPRLVDLYSAVQRKTLRVDEALDEIMGPG
jgi:hypothetical protein